MTRKRCAGALAVILVATFIGAPAAPADTVRRLGDVGAIALPVSGLVVAAAHRDGKGSLQLLEAYGSAMAVVYILKATVDRERPDGGSQSFPSGHAASAFAGAAFLQRRYGWAYGGPGFAIATFVAWSRVKSKRHWTTDVIAGGAIGVASNLAFTHRRPTVTLQPALAPGGAGLTLEVRW
jgi:membrane-associated phospholipid phosphatase